MTAHCDMRLQTPSGNKASEDLPAPWYWSAINTSELNTQKGCKETR